MCFSQVFPAERTGKILTYVPLISRSDQRVNQRESILYLSPKSRRATGTPLRPPRISIPPLRGLTSALCSVLRVFSTPSPQNASKRVFPNLDKTCIPLLHSLSNLHRAVLKV